MQEGDLANVGNGPQFKKHCCFSASCSSIRRFTNVVGLSFSVLNCGLDIAYAAKSIYFSKFLYVLCILFVVLRAALSLLVGQIYFVKYFLNYKPKMSETEGGIQADGEGEVDENGNENSEKGN